jgi:hypothetical protein
VTCNLKVRTVSRRVAPLRGHAKRGIRVTGVYPPPGGNALAVKRWTASGAAAKPEPVGGSSEISLAPVAFHTEPHRGDS